MSFSYFSSDAVVKVMEYFELQLHLLLHRPDSSSVSVLDCASSVCYWMLLPWNIQVYCLKFDVVCTGNNNNKNNNIKQDNVYGAVIMLRALHGSFDECSSKSQVAADLWTKPTDLTHRPACSLYRPRQLKNYILPYIFITQHKKADTHFTIRQRVEG